MASNLSEKKDDLKAIIASWDSAVPDSKLDKLVQLIKGIFSENVEISGQKILIFCVFRATINYLRAEIKKELTMKYPDIFIETISGEDDINEIDSDNLSPRDRKRIAFKNSSEPSILICSEVASEGLDFQFCYYLINYDMPWNPAKLEQRVGRIDRLGQKAEKITVINLVNPSTIEDHIMSKLFERIQIFNNTLGPLGELIGRYQKDFTNKILSPVRTEEEKKRYEKQVLENIQNKLIEQTEFDKNQIELLSADQMLPNNAIKENAFSKAEVFYLWRNFLNRVTTENNLKIQVVESKGIYSLALSQRLVEFLIDLVNLGTEYNTERRKRKYYEDLLNKLVDNNGLLKYTFDHDCALDNLDVEYISITHSFVIGLIKKLHANFDSKVRIVSLYTDLNELDEGKYLLLIYRYFIVDALDTSVVWVEEKHLIYNCMTGTFSWAKSTSLVDKFQATKIAVSEGTNGIEQTLNQIYSQLEPVKKNMARQILDAYISRVFGKKDLRASSISSHYDRQISQYKILLASSHDERIRKNYEAQVGLLQNQKKVELAKIERDCFTISIKCKGIIQIHNRGAR